MRYRGGEVTLYGQSLLLSEIPQHLDREIQILRGVGNTIDDVTIVIRADKDFPIGKIQAVIRVCQDQGFERFALRVRVEE
jgi:biopolymer transport protein ExbD